jgi:hypothetical protein
MRRLDDLLPAAVARRVGADRPGAVLAPAVLVGAVVCGGLALALAGGSSPGRTAPALPATAIPHSGPATRVAVGTDRAWTVDLASRRLRTYATRTGRPLGAPATLGSASEVALDLAGRGRTAWIALARIDGGGGHVVRIGPSGARRALSTGDLAPRRIAVLPGGPVVMSTARVAALRPGGGRRWTRPAGRAVDLATGAGSVWTLARDADGSGSRLTRWSPDGRRLGARSLPGAATALAVADGAVWVANGCAGGVARAPVGPGPVACLGGRWGAGDVAAGPAGAWVADADGARVLRLGADGALEGAARVPGRPRAVACRGGVAWVVDAAGGLTRVG